MRNVSLSVAVAVLSSSLCLAGAKRPLAFTGDSGLRAFQVDVTVDNRVCVDDCTKELLPPSEYGRYAAVVIESSRYRKNSTLWKTPEDLASVRAYVEGGGVVIVDGWAGSRIVDGNPGGCELLGVKHFAGGANSALGVRFAGDGRLLPLGEGLSCSADGLMPGVETLAEAEFKDGRKAVVVTRNAIGKGAIYWSSATCDLLDRRFSSLNKSLGEADANGVFVPTPEGEAVTALRKFFADILVAIPDLDRSAPPNDWAVKPLGAPGSIDTNGTFATRPEWRKPPKFALGIPFLGNGAKGVVVASPGVGAWLRIELAEEVAWHLERMCGVRPKIVKAPPTDRSVPSIVIAGFAKAKELGIDAGTHPHGTSVIRRFGNCLYVGGSGSGLSYAVTYLLEALGCRYLWPGPLGKVIPKRSSVVLPEIDFTYTPMFKFRKMRQFPIDYQRDGNDIQKFWGIGLAEYAPLYRDGRFDRKGNREFFKWHGVNDKPDLVGTWQWGHHFRDYWQKYGKEHPDWFALQPNGSRDQLLGADSGRPCLCLSNTGLVERAANDALEAFRKYEDLKSFSICLPDGGPSTQCMCSKCRALDPVNAAPNPFIVGNPWWRQMPYVALSDRVMHFNNAVAERVVKEFPDAKLGVYVYSMYEKPTVAVKPHPALVLLTVAGYYGSESSRGYARSNIAYWSRYDNMLLWRPNVFFSYSMAMPQNYARLVFEDMELFKRNHVIGTDFDCVSEQFAVKGLIWYITAKAHRNPDAISYDDLVDDYCQAGFGAAAKEIRAYFDALEDMCNRAARLGKGNSSYVQTFDPDALERLLAAAEAKAAGDGDVVARIAYLRIGLAAGRIEKRLGEAWAAKSRKGVLAAQKELKEFVRDVSLNRDPFALCPVWAAGTYHSPNMKNPNF